MGTGKNRIAASGNKRTDLNQIYGDDLTFIHEAGFTSLASAGARLLIDELAKHKLVEGPVLDLGCGGGTLSGILSQAGFQTHGFDRSPAMIRFAQEKYPSCRFEVGSIADCPLPTCIAIATVGEAINYVDGVYRNDDWIARWSRRVFKALQPGGLLLFDYADLDRYRPERNAAFARGSTWTVFAKQYDFGTFLKRDIVACRSNCGSSRRTYETHWLRLFAPDAIESCLSDTGFVYQRLKSYGKTMLPPGMHAVLAQKPWH